MTNAEKARELCKLYQANRASLFQHLLAMAEWKDEQFAQEKQNLIDKTCEWLKNNIGDYYMTCEFEQWFDDMFEDLKEEMKKI